MAKQIISRSNSAERYEEWPLEATTADVQLLIISVVIESLFLEKARR